MQVVNDSVECAVKDVQQYAHMNRGPGDLDDVILATNHRFIMAVWHSYTRTILMQYRAVILSLSLLMCDKLDSYFILLILHDDLSL